MQCIAYLPSEGSAPAQQHLCFQEEVTVPGRGLTLTLQRFAAQELNCNCPSFRPELSQN